MTFKFAIIYYDFFLMLYRNFCLFDVCDLYISNKETASDVGKKLIQVTPIDSTVEYNACKMDSTGCIPYLATSVWKYGDSSVNPPLPSLPKSSIKKEKVQIFNQVCLFVIHGQYFAKGKAAERETL